jgi:hypothetical protein
VSDDFREFEKDLERFDREPVQPPIGAIGADFFGAGGESRPRIEVSESSRSQIPQNAVGAFDFVDDGEFRRRSRPEAEESDSFTQRFDSSGEPVEGGDETATVLRELLEVVRAMPAEIVEQLRSS